MINASYIKNLKSFISSNFELPENWINFSTDTRTYADGMFVAISGEKYNAVNFLGKVIEKGCKCIVYSNGEMNNKIIKEISKNNGDVQFIKVSDSVKFLQEIASVQTKNWQQNGNLVFGISGSNGKTTHKEMIFHILNQLFPNQVIKTLSNNNNHLGVPLTLLSLNPNTKYAVVEFGSNHPGEMKTVCDIAMPKVGITTNIGSTHMEFFPTIEDVFIEEAYIYKVVMQQNENERIFLINQDDEQLQKLESAKGVYRYGHKGNLDNQVSVTSEHAEIVFKGKKIRLTNEKLTGEHNFYNLSGSVLLCLYIFPDKITEITKAAMSFTPSMNRSQWIDFEDLKIFLDAYNANPSSMRLSVKGFVDYLPKLKALPKDCCAIIGSMHELGELSPSLHQELGSYLNSLGLAKVIFVGKFAQDFAKDYRGSYECFDNITDFKLQAFAEHKKKYKVFFIKGSRSLQLESLIDITI